MVSVELTCALIPLHHAAHRELQCLVNEHSYHVIPSGVVDTDLDSWTALLVGNKIELAASLFRQDE